MNNRQGIVWAPILIIVATILVAGVSGYFLYKAGKTDESKNTNAVVNQTNNNVSTNLNTNVATNTNQMANSNANASVAQANDNVFDFDKAKVGDMVAGMKIVSIGKYRPDANDNIQPNRKVVFSGRATVTGTYYERGISGLTLEKLTADSQKKLPRFSDETRSVWFSFTNQATVRTALSDLETDGDGKETTVVIDSYTINSYPSEVGNTALFVEVDADPTAGWKTYTNPTRGYSIKYPPTWTATTNSTEPEAVNISPPEPNPGTHITHNLIISPTPKIDASDCRNVDLEDHKSTVVINGVSLIRTVHGCSFDWISTYFPQPSGYTGYFDVTWAKTFEGEYPEYELMLKTFKP